MTKMTLEEAIDFILNKIQIDVRFCSDEDIKKTEAALKLAISALEKQIPKKLKDDGWLYCPICGRDVLMDRFNYCPDCGQALDWSDDDD